jgi:hypothetical protein
LLHGQLPVQHTLLLWVERLHVVLQVGLHKDGLRRTDGRGQLQLSVLQVYKVRLEVWLHQHMLGL